MALSIRTFAVFLGLMYLTEIMTAAYKKSAITTIERRFDLRSTATALVATSYQFGSLIVLLFVSYYGAKWHRPRLLGIGSVLIFLGHMIASLPQFLGGRHKYVDITQHNATDTGSATNVEMCERSTNDSSYTMECTAQEINQQSSDNSLYILIVIGMMLCGIGGSGTSSLGLAYVDDYAHPQNRPVYVGLIFTLALIGPAFGFIFGAMILRIWVDVGWVDTDSITITPRDPGWVGAWWLGFIIGGIVVGISGIMFWFFPKTMEVEKLKSEKKLKNNNEEKLLEKQEKEKEEIKSQDGFFKSVKRILMNKQYALLQLYWFFSAHVMIGIITFIPKYLETQFGLSASSANMLYGAISIPALVVGTIFGSFLVKRFKMNRYVTSCLIVFIGIMVLLTKLPLALLGCDTIDIAGVTVPYQGDDELSAVNTMSYCNEDCNCQEGIYSPICGEDFVTYISPCHAGCQTFETGASDRIQNYTQCSCLSVANENGIISGNAQPGRCVESKCPHLLKFAMFFLTLSAFFGGILTTPVYLLLLRAVEVRDKSFAIGISYLFLRIFAWIPGPIYYGAMIDSSCLYWGSKTCSNTAYCKIYDNTAFRYKFVFTLSAWKVLSIIVAFALTRHYKHLPENQNDNKSLEDTNFNGPTKEVFKLTPEEEKTFIEAKTTVV